ncbi:MAG TPA: hypothetical protein VNY05_21400 [Candidatus Acidoferrales bacterium]|nr:hypothetical protein [Candidatus Acidoferrales bacterium]
MVRTRLGIETDSHLRVSGGLNEIVKGASCPRQPVRAAGIVGMRMEVGFSRLARALPVAIPHQGFHIGIGRNRAKREGRSQP